MAARKSASKSTAAKPAAKRRAGPNSKSAQSATNAARKAVIATALAMSRGGLSPGRSGNVSMRWRDGMLITPSGMAYETLKPADINVS